MRITTSAPKAFQQGPAHPWGFAFFGVRRFSAAFFCLILLKKPKKAAEKRRTPKKGKAHPWRQCIAPGNNGWVAESSLFGRKRDFVSFSPTAEPLAALRVQSLTYQNSND
ncbi:MAG TPA: hypothetical protein VMG10_02905 [Gemmataceae bacterium]|nr:hypothetical protein [Gemmataceae bacterium]